LLVRSGADRKPRGYEFTTGWDAPNKGNIRQWRRFQILIRPRGEWEVATVSSDEDIGSRK
jgi:hypothetical protein